MESKFFFGGGQNFLFLTLNLGGENGRFLPWSPNLAQYKIFWTTKKAHQN